LAAAYPPGAKKLRDSLTKPQQAEMAIELAGFEQKHEPGLAKSRVPALMEILRDSTGKRNWQERGPAIDLLSELPLDAGQQSAFESLLLAELKNPRRDDVAMSALGHVVPALARLPEPDRHWNALVSADKNADGFGEIDQLIDTLAELALAKPDPRMRDFARFLKPRFSRCKGLMDDLFLTALALDLRELAPDIARLASSGPEVADGEGAHSWSGGFTGPGNQRYHTARHVTAIWLEPDADTRAMLWAGLLVKQPYEFRGDSAIAGALRDRFRGALQSASKETSVRALRFVRASTSRERNPIDWLDDDANR
ncbi:MAG TPA: hypothetical protein VFY13_08610, partial [Luteolibacter sp.]|nr:hypothetical protein [Luteolibacter sp.]